MFNELKMSQVPVYSKIYNYNSSFKYHTVRLAITVRHADWHKLIKKNETIPFRLSPLGCHKNHDAHKKITKYIYMKHSLHLQAKM